MPRSTYVEKEATFKSQINQMIAQNHNKLPQQMQYAMQKNVKSI